MMVLENIEEEYYESIIVSTKTIEDFKALILTYKIRDLTNKSIAVCGFFGSGKTVLFQYIDMLVKIHHPELISVTISIDARESQEEMRTQFFSQLASKLKKIHFQILKYVLPDKGSEDFCRVSLESLAESKKILFIFIEDIYKHSARGEYKEQVIGFIQSLQIIRRVLSSSGIKTSFFFSSIVDIVDTIRNDHSISGSVDNYYEMGAIGLEDALTMINKRFKAFAKNPEDPPQISREFLFKLKKSEETRGTLVGTFRDYIDILKERFSRLEFNEDSFPIHYDVKTITNLRIDIETEFSGLHQSFLFLKSSQNR